MKSICLRECENAWYKFWVQPDWTQATLIASGPLSTLIWSRNCPKVADQKSDADEESCQEHALKINNSQFMIQKPFPGFVAGDNYDYFIFLKNMGKLALFRSKIEC